MGKEREEDLDFGCRISGVLGADEADTPVRNLFLNGQHRSEYTRHPKSEILFLLS